MYPQKSKNHASTTTGSSQQSNSGPVTTVFIQSLNPMSYKHRTALQHAQVRSYHSIPICHHHPSSKHSTRIHNLLAQASQSHIQNTASLSSSILELSYFINPQLQRLSLSCEFCILRVDQSINSALTNHHALKETNYLAVLETAQDSTAPDNSIAFWNHDEFRKKSLS